MRWVVLAILVAIVLWPLRPAAPDPDDATVAARNAVAAEFTEPYRVLAAKLPARDDDSRRKLDRLSAALFKVQNAKLGPIEKVDGHWQAAIDAELVCALSIESPDLGLREAAAFAMAYRTVCTASAEPRVLQRVKRLAIFARRDGRWVASLRTVDETNP